MSQLVDRALRELQDAKKQHVVLTGPVPLTQFLAYLRIAKSVTVKSKEK